MSSQYIDLPSSTAVVPTYPSATDLPPSGNIVGSLAVTIDTSTLYEWNGSSWVAIATPGAAIALDGLIGDLTATGPGVAPGTLATVNANVGSFGSASASANFTVNGKGLVTAAGSSAIQIAESQVTNLVADLAAKQSATLTNTHILVGNASNVATDVALSGDATIANTGAITVASNAISNSKLAQMATKTIKGNNTGGTANALDLTVPQTNVLLGIVPTIQSTNYTLIASDANQMNSFTGSSASTFTITSAATLGAGWTSYVQHNGGQVNLTLSPASGTIDGVASFVIHPGDARLILSDGSNFTTVCLQGGFREISVAGANTFNVPKGASRFYVEIWGAGGGGGSGSATAPASSPVGGSGGGGGACVYSSFRPSDLGNSVTVTIGTGGNGGAAGASAISSPGNVGSPGGNTTFGALLTAFGGGGGGGGTGNASGFGGGGGGWLSVGGVGGGSQSSGGQPSTGTGIAGQFGGASGNRGNNGSGLPSAFGGASGAGNVTNGSVTGGSATKGGAGGGGGGSITSSHIATAGAAGGSTSGVAGGGGGGGAAGTASVAGGKGTDGSASSSALGPGLAGGGGGSGFDSNGGGTDSSGGDGGVGGVASGGGGGGSTIVIAGPITGAGGVGGNGLARVWYV